MKLTTEYLLTLLKTPKIGQISVKFINDNIGYRLSSVAELYDAITELKSKNSKLSIPRIEDLKLAHEGALKVMENADRLNIKAINCNQIEYPSKLKRLSDFPIIIYLKGELGSISSNNSVAIIGTREPSDFGIRAGKRISGIFAENNFTIISGLAVGCDTAGHIGAVDKNLPTVAVLASGVDIIYPKENKYLSERIIETGGSLISEYEPGTKTFPQQFVQRDRIQSGLSDGLIVLETGIKGGTMHAVSAARKMNMPIACLTGHPIHMADFEKIKGNAYLIENGAYALGNAEQINSFIIKLNPEIQISDLSRSEAKLQAEINNEGITSPKIDEPIEQKEKLLPTHHNISTPQVVEVNFDKIDQRTINRESATLSELKSLVLKLMEEQKETNKLLSILISQSQKEKNLKKKANNQSSLL